MKKKFLKDVIINTIATYAPLIILQLIIFPVLAKDMGDTQYGKVITIISLFTVISYPFGNSLNNIRLLENEKDVNAQAYGKMLSVLTVINAVLMVIVLPLYIGKMPPADFIGILLVSVFCVIKEYLVVLYRVYLDYNSFLMNNLIFSVGYLVGFGIYKITGLWEMVYLMGYGVSIANIVLKYKVYKLHGMFQVKIKKGMIKDFTYLYIGNMISSSLSYLDKLMIYPLIGASMVSIYYAASFSGKIIMLGIGSLSSVLLSYVTKYERIERKSFWKFLAMIVIVCTVGYVVCVVINPYIVKFLYPQWLAESKEIIPVTSAISMVAVLNSLLHPFVLKFCEKQMQIIINAVNLFFYVILSIFLYKINGIMGFCIGILAAYLIKTVMMIVIYIRQGEK